MSSTIVHHVMSSSPATIMPGCACHRTIAAAALTGATVLLSSALHAGQIPVVEHSFESPDFTPCSFSGAKPPGWTSGCGAWGSWNAGLGDECYFNGFPSGVPDGVQNGFINCPNSPMVQVLDAVVESGEQYTLVVDVGRRSDGYPMQAYRIRLVAGPHILAEDNDTLDPPLGGWLTSTISFTAPPGHAAIGLPLEIQLSLVEGPQANFDNVRMYTGPYSPPGVTGDIDGDGAVTGSDLGLLLGAWGPCSACANCPADLNGDCVVDGSDLGILLGGWSA